jgi:hypothetical protein
MAGLLLDLMVAIAFGACLLLVLRGVSHALGSDAHRADAHRR